MHRTRNAICLRQDRPLTSQSQAVWQVRETVRSRVGQRSYPGTIQRELWKGGEQLSCKTQPYWAGSVVAVNPELTDNSAWKSVSMPWNNTGKAGKKWQTAAYSMYFSGCRAGCRDSQGGKTMWNNAYAVGWQSCTQEGKEIYSFFFFLSMLLMPPSKQNLMTRRGMTAVNAIQRMTERFSYLLTTMLLETLCSDQEVPLLMLKLPSPSPAVREDCPLYQLQDTFLRL